MLLCFIVSSTSLSASLCSELPIVVLICSYNNAPWVKRNLNSVFSQNYTNYRILYIDDCSDDDTAAQVLAYTQRHDTEHKLTLITNTERCRKMKNVYNAVHSCDDHEIIVQLDGDDWFCDDQLFAHINHMYTTQDIWLTYGSYMDVPGDSRGYAQKTDPEVIKDQSYRNAPWLYMPTRTFYAWLFKHIDLKDFIAEQVKGYQGLFFPSADDPAFMFPMLEMAGTRFAYINHISYVANRDNPLIGRKFEPNLQGASGCDVRHRTRYQTLKSSSKKITGCHATADMLIFFENNLDGLSLLLDSISMYMNGLERIFIVYDDHIPTNPLEKLINHSSIDIHLIPFIEISNIEKLLKNDYVLISTDLLYLHSNLNIRDFINHLEKTGAYGFYFSYTPTENPFSLHTQHIYEDIYAWKFNCGGFAFFNSLDMALMKTKDAIKQLASITPKKTVACIADFKNEWLSAHTADMHQVGLFLKESLTKGTYQLSNKLITLPPYFDPPPGRGYRTPNDFIRKRERKIRLTENRKLLESGQTARPRLIKKRTLPLS